MNPERRHSIRRRLYRISYMQIEPGNGAIVIDLSQEGLSFQAVAAVHDSQQVHFWLSSPITGRFKVCGELAWTDETRKRGGLRFLDLTKVARQYVRELLAQPAVPAELQLEPTREVVLQKATKKTADQPCSHGQSARVPLGEISIRGLTKSPRHDEPVASQSSKPLLPPYTSPMLCRASLSELREPEIVDRDLHELRAQARRQKFRQGLLTGIAASVAFMGLLALTTYRRQIGDVLALAGNDLSSRNEPGASYTAAAPAVSTPNAPPSGPSASADAVPAGQIGGTIRPDTTSATDLVSASPEASTPAPATPPADKPAASPPAPATKAETTQAAEFGQYDLTMAEKYLSGSDVSRNGRTAAQWLWAAVEKGNVSAEIMLSDLYVAGEGVEKNCEQARILLQAAAKKGNAIAAQKMHAVDNYGICARASSTGVPMSFQVAIP
jgi:hypothetical protein